MIGRFTLALLLLCLGSQRASADVVEMIGGDRVEGALKEATPAGVFVEVAGQRIRFDVSKVRAIYFGSPAPTTAQPPSVTAPSAAAQPARPAAPAAGALYLLQSLRSAVATGIGHREYQAQVNSAAPIVALHVSGSPAPPAADALRDAMRYYLLADWAWSNQGLTSRTVWLKRDEALTRCPAYQTFAREMQDKGEAYYAERMRNYLAIAEGVIPVLWSCAADKIAEAEKVSVSARQ